MKTEITLQSVPEEKPGFIVIILYLAFIYGLFWVINQGLIYLFRDITNELLVKILNNIIWIGYMFLHYKVVKYFLYLIQKQRRSPVILPVLSISEMGINYYTESKKTEWKDISEIQIIDAVLSVTVDLNPEKDFKLNLSKTDLQKQMTQDSFEKLLEYHYKKDVYIYNAPSSCGCGC
ncbi:hypothetical protein [Chryseobacterium sp. BIGb0232]|uniref:hypothetical protein n=1 Tax=Chryseobacterium sp. BIGb0232 TaxID=2940598 RepID=UPI000F483FC6|nr:hypothetical protein [Chryseobacterium sp. BIGb0232]MCS4301676.1 hypothetical protein [Chryseobacterium sp. BIGb0232]ROS19470.1 hypothetical protein EDF65_0159 [Chryseobacterium nakagawai]